MMEKRIERTSGMSVEQRNPPKLMVRLDMIMKPPVDNPPVEATYSQPNKRSGCGF